MKINISKYQMQLKTKCLKKTNKNVFLKIY